MEKKISKVGMGMCSCTPEVMDHAFEHNIRMIDLGYGYQGENVAEKQVGKWLKGKKREDFYIIDKLPLFEGLYTKKFNKSCYRMGDKELEGAVRILLEEQLKYTNAKYFDCYMLHAIFDMQHVKNYDAELDLGLYKKLVPILLKLKEEGLIKSIGFSCHISYERLCMFLQEIDPENKVFTVAEVSYNVLNDKGYSSSNPSMFSQLHQIMVWDAIGEKGIHMLKEKGYTIIDMMPHESGRLSQISTAPDYYRWNDTFINNNKDIDYILVGTKNPQHIDDMLIAAGEMEDPLPVPDMRIINSGVPGHCHE